MAKVGFEPLLRRACHEKYSLMLKIMGFSFACLVLGWLLGSAFPLDLYPHSGCHRLGGALRIVEGPGKPTECVIPWESP